MRKLYNSLGKHELTPNEFYVLWCLEHKKECTLSDTPAILDRLKSKGHVKEGKLDKKISKLVERLDMMFSDDPAKRMSLTTSYSDNIIKYQEMWPKGKVGVNNRRLWTSAKNIEAAFKWFFNHYNYDWELVLRATEFYLNQEDDKGYPFTRTSKYFIRKMDPGMGSNSELADYCELILDGETEEKVQHFV